MTLQHLKLGHRLGLAFALLLVLTTLVSAFAISRLALVNEATRDVATHWLPATQQLAEYRAALNLVRRAQLQHLMASTDEELTRWTDRIETGKRNAIAAWASYRAVPATGEEQRLATTIEQTQERFFKAQAELMKASRETDGVTAELRQLAGGESSTSFRTLLDTVGQLVQLQADGAQAAYNQSQATFAATLRSVILAVVATVAFGAALAWWFTRSITRPVGAAVGLARAVAAGDLTAHIEVRSQDEIGQLCQALGAMVTRLREVVADVRSSVESVGTAAAQISVGNLDLSQRTEEQATNLQQTAASMEQLTSTVRQNAQNAQAAAQLSQAARDVAVQGGEVVGDVVSTMGQISDSSRKIADIITVIDGIAFQTNILALNAAVEAARAGEQGRGFAVVAGEVRTLAQRSAGAAKEIKTLIQDSVDAVGHGADLVARAGTTMADIVAQVQRVNDLVGEISSASSEQAQGIDLVGRAVSQLDEVTQQNAALVEESAAAAESLKHQAQRLSTTVSVFQVSRDSLAMATALPQAPTQAPAPTPHPNAPAAAGSSPSHPAAREPGTAWTTF